MNIYFLERPLFIWFGVLSYLSLFITAFFGINIRRFGIKFHKIFGIITFLLATLHLILGGLSWIF